MFSSKKARGRFNESCDKEFLYERQRREALKRLKDSMKSLCDDDSPVQRKPFVFKNKLDSTSSDETTFDTEAVRAQTNKEQSKSDKQKSMKNKRSNYTNARSDKNKKEDLDSDSSDSEDNINKKRAERRERRSLMTKLKEKNSTTLPREDNESSSSKEFQMSKISHVGSKMMKKLTQTQMENRVMSTDSNSESVNEKISVERMSEKQNIFFKSGVNKILNKMKELCSEYELQVDNFKWKHLKKDIRYHEVTAKVYRKLRNLIESIKEEFDVEEKKLINFYEDWEKNCRAENTEHEDSSLSEDEESKAAVNEKESEKLKNPSQRISVSECDEEIFSSNETQAKEKKDDTNKIKDLSASEKLLTDDSDQIEASPILIKSKQPLKAAVTQKSKLAEETEELSRKDQTDTSEARPASGSVNVDASMDDIFDDTMIENTSPKPKDINDDESETNVPLDKNVRDSTINEMEDKKKDSSDSVEEETNCASDPIDEEERAKRALLASDSDSVPTNSLPVSDATTIVDLSEDDNSETRDDLETAEPNKKRKKNNNKPNESEDKPQEDLAEIMEAESRALRTLLESNSDDSLSNSEKPKSKKVKLSSVYSSEDSSSDDDSKLDGEKQNSLQKRQKKNGGRSSSIEKQDNSSKDSNSNNDSESSIGKRYSLRNKNAKNKNDSRLLKVLLKTKLKDLDSDKIFASKVVLERLPEGALKKHNDALEKSREYLESKEFRNLINLDRLKRNTKSSSSSRRSSIAQLGRTSKSKNKEEEETLLDHLKRIEEGDLDVTVENDAVSDRENDKTIAKPDTTIQSNEDLIKQADDVAKKMLLYSSDSDGPLEKEDLSESNEEKNKNKSEKPTKKQSAKSTEKDSDKENDEEQEKSRWRKDKLLTMKLTSDSDSDVAKQKWEKKQIKLAEIAKNDQAEDSEKNNEPIVKRKLRTRRKIMDSDDSDVKSEPDSDSSLEILETKSSDSDSSVGKRKKGKKRKTQNSSDSDSETVVKKPKPKRRRIKNMSSDSDAESDEDQMNNSQGTPGKKGRKNIRKVMEEELVTLDTKLAAKAEEERLKRIAERQKLYNEMYEARLAGEEKVDKLILDFDPETKKELVTVNEQLVKRLKPHQAKGIKFMWDACFESLERTKNSPGSGCIIAHCMGLGKTLQVIALVHTLLTHEQTGVKTVLIVSPLNTVLNWLNEFKLWLKDLDDGDDIEVYEMTKLKKNVERFYQLQSWHRTGGVMIIGYEMFRNLSGNNNRIRKKMKEDILKYLIDPGPDVIVCDEGHLLKNEDTALSKSIKRIKTLRRIVLTGTPLQNNLIEYHCMVQFVKPSLLGTKAEFSNRFVNPITNGQFDDSTEYDVKLMKKRAYVLNKMLKGCVQRCDYSVLTPFLPPKQEYVIFVSLTETQINLYRYYLTNFARQGRHTATLFADFQALQRIWTHPYVLRMNSEKVEKLNEKKLDSDSEGSLKEFIDDDSESETEESSSDSSSVCIEEDDAAPNTAGKSLQNKTSKRATRSTPIIDVPDETEEPEKKEEEWWSQFVKPEDLEDMRASSKLMLLFGILKESEQIGDKVLVFSQSLYSLTLIERFLEKIHDGTQKGSTSELIGGHTGSWLLGLDYFRLDGQTSPENRSMWCNVFNRPTNTRARLFLISTRAGGLGINLTAANRVIIFDASWNPSHDVQSIFRVYRFGQKKPCYVYRFLAAGTMEEKIYNRQVTKLSLSCRVVDEQQIERHYSNNDLSELYNFEPKTGDKPTLSLPKDRLLAEIFLKYKDCVENYHEHDSLLENKTEEELNEEERQLAWTEYEEEKKGKPKLVPNYAIAGAYIQNPLMNNQYTAISQMNMATDYSNLRELLKKDYPNATPEMQQLLTTRAVAEMYNYWEKQTMNNVTRVLEQPIQNTNQIVRPIRPKPVALNRVNYIVPNINATVSNQPNRTTSGQAADDDVIEVTSTSTVNNINKNQEE